jgi:hypothetical protein
MHLPRSGAVHFCLKGDCASHLEPNPVAELL